MQYTDDQPAGKDKLRSQRFEHEDGRGGGNTPVFPEAENADATVREEHDYLENAC